MSAKGGKPSEKEKRPRISEFFAGKYVLVTGASGFMGKVLLEKLLRSCPGLAGVYLLLRPKRGKAIQERVDDMLQSPVSRQFQAAFPKLTSFASSNCAIVRFRLQLFSSLESRSPGLARRALVAVSGDVSQPGLGLSPEDRAMLQANVAVVFHGAATVRFDEPLKTAVIINVRGTRELAELACGMKKLQVRPAVTVTTPPPRREPRNCVIP